MSGNKFIYIFIYDHVRSGLKRFKVMIGRHAYKSLHYTLTDNKKHKQALSWLVTTSWTKANNSLISPFFLMTRVKSLNIIQLSLRLSTYFIQWKDIETMPLSTENDQFLQIQLMVVHIILHEHLKTTFPDHGLKTNQVSSEFILRLRD